MALSRQQLLSLARLGAVARIRELQAEIASLKKQFGTLLNALAGNDGGHIPVPFRRRRRKMSAAARARIAAAQKARWAKLKAAKVEAPASGGGRKRKTMSAAARARIAAAQKVRWAMLKKAKAATR